MNQNEELKRTLKRELKTKLFRVLAVTAFVANAVAFMICILLNGMSTPTCICGICCLVLMIFGIIGVVTKRKDVSAVGIVSIAAIFELPFFMYVYGPSTSAYLILAVACIALFLPKSIRWIMFGLVFIINVTCIILYYVVPAQIDALSKETEMFTMLWAYCIVAIALFALVQIIVKQYEMQRAQIMKMTGELELVAHYDQLTGLYNRRYMMDTLEKWMSTIDKDFIVIYIDLDDYKIINDTYGFVFGDKVLVEFSRILKENIGNMGFASRYGGQEFIVMIDNANKEDTLKMLEKVKEDYAKFSEESKQAQFTFSAGVVVDDKTLDLDEILGTADDRLRQAKRAGKNQIV